MRQRPTVSIIIDNYNYGRFLAEAIDSALQQTYDRTEVIVVDDGSTDNSRAVIADYGARIKAVLKENGGQASAFNAGFRVSRGDVVFFLDSDDLLLPTAVENVVSRFDGDDVAKVHWPLWIVDEQGHRTGEMLPDETLPEGDLRDIIAREGPLSCASPPTSGNAWARRFLDRVFPMPEHVEYYKICGDEYLYNLAPAFGPIKRLADPQGFYRVHGKNNYTGKSFEEKLRLELCGHDENSLVLSKFLRDLGVHVDPQVWKENSWFHQLQAAIQEMAAWIPPGDAFLLADGYAWGLEASAHCHPVPFPEPADDSAAIQELEQQRRSGVRFVVFGWPAFWWLDYYSNLHAHLRANYRCLLENGRLIIFDLRS